MKFEENNLKIYFLDRRVKIIKIYENFLEKRLTMFQIIQNIQGYKELSPDYDINGHSTLGYELLSKNYSLSFNHTYYSRIRKVYKKTGPFWLVIKIKKIRSLILKTIKISSKNGIEKLKDIKMN